MKIKSIFYSAAGVFVPGVILLLIIPKITAIYGLERIGYITLLWGIVGVSSLFDLGVSRAITHKLASSRDKSDWSKTSREAVGVVITLVPWAIFVGILALLALNYYILSSSGMSNQIKTEIGNSTPVFGVAVALAVLQAAFRGFCEGINDFKITAWSKIINALIFFIILFSYTWIGNELDTAIAGIAIGRFFALIYTYIKIREVLFVRPVFDIISLKEVYVFGFHASISNVCSTILVISDKLIAGLFMAPVLFGVYSVANEMISRILFLPGAVSSVLYPSIAKNGVESARSLLLKSIVYISIPVACALLFILFFSSTILNYFLPAASDDSFRQFEVILMYMSVGIFCNSIAQSFYAGLHGLGHVKLTANLHLFELSIFPILMYYMTLNYGLHGLLSVWVSRHIFDSFLLMWLFLREVNKHELK